MYIYIITHTFINKYLPMFYCNSYIREAGRSRGNAGKHHGNVWHCLEMF